MSSDINEENSMKYICINCQKPSNSLFKKYSEGVVRLTECEYCGEIVDKYIEYDVVLLCIDLFLHYIEAYRHVLCNLRIERPVRLYMIFLLSNAYETWINERTRLKMDKIYDLELMFYKSILSAAIEFSVFIMVIILFDIVYNGKIMNYSKLKHIICSTIFGFHGNVAVVLSIVFKLADQLSYQIVLYIILIISHIQVQRGYCQRIAMVSAGINKDQIRRCVEATETAADLIRDGDLARRQVSLELRDLQLTMHEDFERLKKEINEFEAQVKNERIESGKWMNEKLNTAKEAANQAIKSNILLKDIQVLEKKVDILSESVINVNKAYYNYEKNVDVDDLMDQVREMAYRTEKKEKELLSMFSGPNSNKKIEEVLRGAVEGLLGLRSNNPALIEEARQLATELRVYRDAAANNNLMTLIGRYDSTESASSVDSKDSTFSKLSGSVYSSTKSDSTASSLSTSTVASNTESKKTSSQMSI